MYIKTNLAHSRAKNNFLGHARLQHIYMWVKPQILILLTDIKLSKFLVTIIFIVHLFRPSGCDK